MAREFEYSQYSIILMTMPPGDQPSYIKYHPRIPTWYSTVKIGLPVIQTVKKNNTIKALNPLVRIVTAPWSWLLNRQEIFQLENINREDDRSCLCTQKINSLLFWPRGPSQHAPLMHMKSFSANLISRDVSFCIFPSMVIYVKNRNAISVCIFRSLTFQHFDMEENICMGITRRK